MTDKDPERLKATGDTPEELVRALQALGRDRDAARLARVAEKLTTTIAASSAPSGGWLQNLLGSKLTLMGIVLGLGALGALGYELASRDSAPIEQPAVPAIAPQEPSVPEAEPGRGPTQASEPAELRVGGEDRTPATQDAVRTTRAPKRTSGSTPSAHAISTSSAEPARHAATAAADEQADVEEPAEAEEQAAPAEPQKPAAQAPAPPPASEELLVHRARKAAASDPASALKLLDEHTARFPSGMLVPEREVLAIEVLRSLGRAKEAEQRLQRFQKRYPQSIHLRRLEQGRSTGPSD